MISNFFVLVDDEEEYEEAGRGSRFLGFMFGNVNDSGGLDADYLDEVTLLPPLSFNFGFHLILGLTVVKQTNK